MTKVRFIPIALCLSTEFALAAALKQNVPPTPSYYKTLKSLLEPNWLKIRPKSGGRDVDLVDPLNGAGGVRFGDSIDTVVGVWGRPSHIHVSRTSPLWRLGMGACRFEFIDNRLVAISIHRVTLANAHLKEGVTFQSSHEQVKEALGKPTRETHTVLTFERDGGYVLRCQFMSDPTQAGKSELIAFAIRHPDYRPF